MANHGLSDLGPDRGRDSYAKGMTTNMEGKGPSKSEDLQLATGEVVAGDMHVSKEVAARCTGELHHVRREH